MLTVLFLLFASVTFYSIGYYVNVVDQFKLESLQKENQALVDELNEINGQIKSLVGKITTLNKEDDMLRVLADLPQIDPDIRKVGVGGPEYINESRLHRLSSGTLELTKKTRLDIDQLLREARLQEASFTELRKTVETEKDKIACLPTIQPTYGYITTYYGFRHHPFTGRREFHRGLDIANRIGAPIYATADGTVEVVGYQGYYGKMIVINHGYGYRTLYGHLHQVLVHDGQKVKRGDLIAKMGNSGRSTGPHLHYEVMLDNKWENPLKYFYASETLTSY